LPSKHGRRKDAAVAALGSGEQFLSTFATFEKWMRQHLHKDESYPYRRLIADLRERAEITEPQELQLQTYGYLRNALAHWARSADGLAIADPRPDALEEFRSLTARVMTPDPVVAVLGDQQVRTVGLSDPVEAFLTLVRDFEFSQAPVIDDGRYRGMLTVGRVARWVSDTDWTPDPGFRSTPVRDVMSAEFEDPEYLVRDPKLTAPEAVNSFAVTADREVISGIVIVDQQAERDVVVRIVVPSDLPALVSATSWRAEGMQARRPPG
jgi:CBS domain-containing protein